VEPKEKDNINIFDKVSFTNKKWKKIYLKQFADIEPQHDDKVLQTEDKYRTMYIYWTVWDNTIVYPTLHVTSLIKSQDFWWKDFNLVQSGNYWVTLKSNLDWKEYKIMWSWTRKLALDTYRDLWLAMLVALLSIYFLLVAKFKSFKTSLAILMTFQYWFFGILPWYSLLHSLFWTVFVSPSMIWLNALSWIIVWNTILLVTYAETLLKEWYSKKDALIKAWIWRRRAILITSLWIIFGSIPILWDPVWGGLGWSIVLGLSVAVIMTLFIAPIFLYDMMEVEDDKLVTDLK
jgi:multidrug efflux pump subunit AcrB